MHEKCVQQYKFKSKFMQVKKISMYSSNIIHVYAYL